MSSERPTAWRRMPEPHETQPGGGRQLPADGSVAPPAEPAGGLQVAIEQARRFARRMGRHWPYAVLGLALGALATAGFVRRYKERYQSETVVYYQPAATPDSVASTADRQDPTLLREDLMRHERLAPIIEELGLYPVTVASDGMHAAVSSLREATSFRSMGKQTFRIGFIGEAPEQAQAVAGRLAQSLVESDRARREEVADKATAFLDEEMARAAVDLRRKEDELSAFVGRYPELGLSERDRAVPLLPAVPKAPPPSAAEPPPARVQGAIPRAAPPAPAPPPPVVVEPDPALEAEKLAAERELDSATQRLAELKRTYTDLYPEVRTVAARADRARARLQAATAAIARHADEQVARAPAPPPPPGPALAPRAPVLRPPTSTPVASAAFTAAVVAPPADALPRTRSQQVALEAEWTRLRDEVGEARERHKRIAHASYQAELGRRSQIGGHGAGVAILDAAYLPAEPLRSRSVFAKLGGVATLLLALGLVIARAALDDRIYDQEDIQQLDLGPVLTVVPSERRAESRDE